jgi:hypothetical protein
MTHRDENYLVMDDDSIGALTHKVIHIHGGHFRGFIKNNDLPRFPAIPDETFEHYNSRT